MTKCTCKYQLGVTSVFAGDVAASDSTVDESTRPFRGERGIERGIERQRERDRERERGIERERRRGRGRRREKNTEGERDDRLC